jgi:DNA-directed RNA polymerase subunit RPC12/RpoP
MSAPALAQQLTFTCPCCGDQVDRLFVDNCKDDEGKNPIRCLRCIYKSLVKEEASS